VTRDVRVDELDSLAQLDAFAADWETLHSEVPGADLFSSPHWFRAWCAAFGADKRPRVLAITLADALVGVLPLVESAVRRRPWLSLHHMQMEDLAFINAANRRGCHVSVRQLSGATNLQSGSIRGGWIARPGMEKTILVAAATHLANRRDWDMLVLPGLRSSDEALFQEAMTGGGLTVESRPNLVTLYGLEPEPWDSYYRRRTRHFRKRFDVAERELKKLGELECRTVTDPDQLATSLGLMYGLGERSWKQKPREGHVWHLPVTSSATAFYRDLCARYGESKRCVFHEIRIAGELVAVMFSVVEHDTVFALQTFYDSSVEHGSPGRLLVRELIDWAAKQGIRWIDFNGNSPLVRMFAFEPVTFGQAWAFRTNGYSAMLHGAMMCVERARSIAAGFRRPLRDPEPTPGEQE